MTHYIFTLIGAAIAALNFGLFAHVGHAFNLAAGVFVTLLTLHSIGDRP